MFDDIKDKLGINDYDMTEEELDQYHALQIADNPIFKSDFVKAIIHENGTTKISSITNTTGNLPEVKISKIDAEADLLSYLESNRIPNILRNDSDTHKRLEESTTRIISLSKNLNGFLTKYLLGSEQRSLVGRITKTDKKSSGE